MLWVHSAVQAVQIPVQSHDVAAAMITTSEGTVLVISAYDPNEGDNRTERRKALDQKLMCVRQAIDEAHSRRGEGIEILICSDFNRHHSLWGGQVGTIRRRKAEGTPIVHLAQEFGLQSMLPAGTITWQHVGKEQYSTIDVILASSGLADRLVRCCLHAHDHGSDHSPIEIELGTPVRQQEPRRSRLLPEKADWTRIGTEVEQRLRSIRLPRVATAAILDETAEDFLNVVVEVVHAQVPRAKASPYAKRWWSPELSLLRHSVSASKNFVTTLRRRGEDTTEARRALYSIRREYFHQMEQQKREHWKAFLADPNNIWKAHAYARTANQPGAVPTLVDNETLAETDEDKADMLMTAFFPVPPEPTTDGRTDRVEATVRRSGMPRDLPPITVEEMREAIFRQHPKKAPGSDEITFDIWRRLFQFVAPWVRWIYQTSLNLGYVPRSWRTAKIVALKKPGKPDYTVPKAYRPISLLPTISKGLESIVAGRLSYLAERYSLLPTNHFGARKQRSPEQALDVLVEKIFEAWKGKRVLSLVTFDVQGAFNGVHPTVLGQRLRERSVPDKMVNWIRSFCEGRTAQIAIGTYTSGCMPIGHAGIPQGSPLSPILYVFYTANLVESKINKAGGSLGFIDDFTAWRTGANQRETTERLQAAVLQPAARWSEESGATFEASKTGFIHFKRRSTQVDPEPALRFFDSEIRPQNAIKILGVTLDTRLCMTTHFDRIIATATKKCLAIGRLRGIRPKQMRQLHRAVIDPTTDYAASTWYARGRLGVQQHTTRLERIQRMGAQAIIGAFRTVSSGVLSDEAGLEAVETRLARKTAKHALEVRALPAQHPLSSIMNDMEQRNDRCRSPLFEIWSRYYKVIQSKKGVGITSKLPYTIPPWDNLYDLATVTEEKEARRTHSRLLSSLSQHQLFYTDASVRNGRVGISVVRCYRSPRKPAYQVIHQEIVGREKTCTTGTAEICAIKAALKYTRQNKNPVWIVSDSQEAIQRLNSHGRSKKSREVVTATLRELQLVREKGIQVKLLWIPGHRGIVGNEWAHRAAQEMTAAHQQLGVKPEQQVRELSEAFKLLRTAVKADIPKGPVQWGKHTYAIDRALPGRHTLRLYGALTHEDAGVLAQARTGHTHLRQYLARVHRIDSAVCECGGGVESVKHVILYCPMWESQRESLKKAAGERWGDVSFLLGGKSSRKDPRSGEYVDGDKWRPNLDVVHATIAFMKSTGRFAAQAVGSYPL